jgi:hypothetical protein
MVHPTQNLNRKQKLIWHLKILAGAVFDFVYFRPDFATKNYYPINSG